MRRNTTTTLGDRRLRLLVCVICLLGFVGLAGRSYGQNTELRLVNAYKPTKVKVLTSKMYLSVFLTDDTLNNTWTTSTQVDGQLISVLDSALVLNTYAKRSSLWHNGDYAGYDKRGFHGHYMDSLSIDTIPFSGIDIITHQRDASSILGGIGGVTSGIALLVAPLVSIDYSGSDFRQDRYFRVAGASMVASICLWVSSAFFPSKRYWLRETEYARNLWSIQATDSN